jgi:hypothetical protein
MATNGVQASWPRSLSASGMTWTRVLERNPEAMKPEPLEGHVWLDTPGKVLHADERYLEFTDQPPAGS